MVMQSRAFYRAVWVGLLLFVIGSAFGQQPAQQTTRRRISVPPTVAGRAAQRPTVAPTPSAQPVAPGRLPAQAPRPAVPPAAPAAVPGPPAPPPPRPAFRLNGREVSEDEVMRFAWTRMGKVVMRDLADEILIRQAAAARGLKVAPAEVDERVKELAAAVGGEEALVAKRGVAGMSALRQQIETELLLAKLVEAHGRVTDAEAREYYEAHKATFTTPTRLHLFEIVTDEAEAAYQARSRLAAGEAFEAIARQVSSAASASSGGDLGWLTLDDIENPVLRSVAATLKPGEVSMPILAKGKYYIYLLREVSPGETKPFEDVKEQVVEALRAQRGATPEGVLNSLRRKATIVVLAAPFKYIEAEYEQLKQIKVVVDGSRLDLRPAPVLLPTGRLIVPAKAFFSALGCHVEWRPATKTMVVTRGKKTVQVSLGSNAALADGRPVTLVSPPELRDGVIWLAPRQVAELLGFRAEWDAVNYALVVTSPAP